MGPHHPSMHGVLCLIVTLDGEDVVDCEPIRVPSPPSTKASAREHQIPGSRTSLHLSSSPVLTAVFF
ncbi:hypothetical protein Gotri_011510 [Gossypium trilobum]|uniref:NADH-quinone oxidoreductase subunit D domain-containing protein n=1 Tax=Gossypium trilobum TaxID=34281 RepID=A0A7J9EU25_9ROSI|nr:hypothetical protein [Gossypium trilobum]